MHINCSRGAYTYSIDLEESTSGDLAIGGKRFNLSVSGTDPELDNLQPLIRAAFESSTGQLSDLTAKTISVGFDVKGARERYPGTGVELISRIEETVHRTIDTMDYDGLKPYLKLLDELDAGKDLSEASLSLEKDERGTICTGVTLAILKNLYREHEITGMVAGGEDLGHAAAIIECQDGYVLIDNRSIKDNRLFFAPFNTTIEYSFIDIANDPPTVTFKLTAGPPGSPTPLTQTYGTEPHIFLTDLPNIGDLISKAYIQHTITSYIPIVVYREDGRALKDIKVSPSRNTVTLKDHITGIKKEFTFKQIMDGELSIDELKAFMGKRVFHSKRRTVYEEIIRVVSQIERIRSLFSEK